MIVGHKMQMDKLRQQVDAGTLHHAQLFLGPEHVGKTKAALELCVLLQGGDSNPALKKQILEGLHPDSVLLLDDGEPLAIKTIREVVERTHQSHLSPHLVFVIENIGRLRPEAMNALLKTLEEPPAGTVFFLTANKEEDVLPTLRSRCVVTHFHTVSEALLKEEAADHVYQDYLVLFSMGRPGKLKKLMADRDYLEMHQVIHQDLNRFLEHPKVAGAFRLSRTYEKHPQVQEMLDILLHRVRTFLLLGQRPPVLQHLDLTEVIDQVEETKRGLTQNVNPKLLLENLFLPFAP